MRRPTPQRLRIAISIPALVLLPSLLPAAPASASSAPPNSVPGSSVPGGAISVGATGLAFDLPDQDDGRIAYPLPPERLNPDGSAPVVIVAYSDRKGADGRRAWTEVLRERYGEHLQRATAPGLVVLPVAHMPSLPAPLRALVVHRYFRKRPPTGLDWERTVAAQLGHTEGVPNLAVLAPDGRFLGVVAGEPTAAAKAELFEVLAAAGLSVR